MKTQAHCPSCHAGLCDEDVSRHTFWCALCRRNWDKIDLLRMWWNRELTVSVTVDCDDMKFDGGGPAACLNRAVAEFFGGPATVEELAAKTAALRAKIEEAFDRQLWDDARPDEVV